MDHQDRHYREHGDVRLIVLHHTNSQGDNVSCDLGPGNDDGCSGGYTDNPNGHYQSVLESFAKTSWGPPYAAAHYTVGETGTIGLEACETNKVDHAGPINGESIGIEMVAYSNRWSTDGLPNLDDNTTDENPKFKQKDYNPTQLSWVANMVTDGNGPCCP